MEKKNFVDLGISTALQTGLQKMSSDNQKQGLVKLSLICYNYSKNRLRIKKNTNHYFDTNTRISGTSA